jgi:hypothetical protein
LVARNVFLDSWRAAKRDQPEWEPDPWPDLDADLAAHLGAQSAYQAANVLWLGLDATLPAATHDRQLLAAQLYYEEGVPFDTLPTLLGCAPPGEAPLSRATLNLGLQHPGVLRFLGFHTLFYANDRLAGHLLGLGDRIAAETLNLWMRKAVAEEPDGLSPCGFTWMEVILVLQRFRNAVPFDRILEHHANAVTAEQLAELLDRLEPRQPFIHQMRRLLIALERLPRTRAREQLAHAGLWKRLAFQYCYDQDLPHRDILERTQRSATLVNYNLTAGMLNVWLSGGRLLHQLARFLGGGRADDMG